MVGGYNSSNTKKLKGVCVERGVDAYHIEGPDQIEASWFVGREHVGITAGTSTPQKVIGLVKARIEEITSPKEA